MTPELTAYNAHTSIDAWSGDALAAALEQVTTLTTGAPGAPLATAHGRRVLLLGGMADEQVHAILPELRRALAARDLLSFTLDPTGALSTHRSFSAVIDAFIVETERRGIRTPEIEELLDGLHHELPDARLAGARSVSPGEHLLTDTLCRLWVALCAAQPAVLVIFNATRSSGQLTTQLDYLTRYYYHDPVADVAVGDTGWRAPRGVLLVVSPDGQPPALLAHPEEVHTLDATAHIEQRVRDFLAREEVVRQLAETTRGDVQRLDALVEVLGSRLDHVLMPRLEKLPGEARALLEHLAIAGQAVELNVLARLSGPGSITTTLRGLLRDGWLQRSMQTGQVRISLADGAFGEVLIARLDDDRRVALHRALAIAAAEDPEPTRHATFITRHAHAARDAELLTRFGMIAGRRLFAEGAIEDAARIFDMTLRDANLGDAALGEAHAMLVDLHARLGQWRRALRHCGLLRRHVSGVRGEVELVCRTAALLMRLNRYETVISLLDGALTRLDARPELGTLRVRAMTLQGEALFYLGEHLRAEELANTALAHLDTLEREHQLQPAEADRARLELRNLLGKVAIFLTHHDRACALFRENLEVAELYGWRDDIARSEGNLGIIAIQRHDHDTAEQHLRRVVSISGTSEPRLRALATLNLAIIHQHRQEYAEALADYLDAMRQARLIGADSVYANAAYNLLTLYRDMGAFGHAARLVTHLHDAHQPQRHTFMDCWASFIEANLYREQGRFDDALALLEEDADERVQQRRDLLFGAHLRQLRKAEVLLCLGRTEQARAIHETFHHDEERDEEQVQALERFVAARIALRDGDPATAEGALREARTIWKHQNNHRERARTILWLVRTLERQERVEEARRELRALAETVVQDAARVPAAMRQDFLATPLHEAITAQLRRLDVPVPRALDTTPAPSEPDAPIRDATWTAWRARYTRIVGDSPRLLQTFRVIDRVADSDSPVLIYGESGTGKELIAEAIHAQSARSGGPLVKVNCAAFVESLLMSELFGHEKGAFTGAVSQKVGRFELASGGTLFLDEIADISMQTQVALLRVLQERQFERVGGTQTLTADVRVVCATNKNLEELVQRGEFRLDLYYRLKGVVLELPSLRERFADIPSLIESFTTLYAADPDHPPRFTREALRHLMAYSWPGNIRELQNFTRSILLFVEHDTVEMRHIEEFADFFATETASPDWDAIDAALDARHHDPEMVGLDERSEPLLAMHDADAPTLQLVPALPERDPEDALIDQIISQECSLSDLKKRLEYESIRRALLETGGNVTQSAKLLQMKRPRLSQIINGDPDLTALKTSLTG